MSKEKRKGTRVENLIVSKLLAQDIPAERIPLSGSLGGKYASDVAVCDLRGEVKARAESVWRTLTGWLGDSDLLFVKEDRQPPYVFMHWDTFTRVMDLYAERYRAQCEHVDQAARRLAEDERRLTALTGAGNIRPDPRSGNVPTGSKS